MPTRYVVRQLLHACAVHMQVDYHESVPHRSHRSANGLTDRSALFLLLTLKQYDEVLNRVSKSRCPPSEEL